MHFLITGIFGLNLDRGSGTVRSYNKSKAKEILRHLGASWLSTSVMSCWCFSCFLVFMILTIAAYGVDMSKIV